MSYDLWVFSPEAEVIRKETLKEKMLAEGWEIRFLPHSAFLGKKNFTLLPSVGALDDSIMLAGWPANQANSELLAQLFCQGDVKQLDTLFMDEYAFGLCSYGVSNYDNTAQPEAKTQYTLYCRGGNLQDAWELMHTTWEAIAVLTNGEAVNPQEGEGVMGPPEEMEWE